MLAVLLPGWVVGILTFVTMFVVLVFWGSLLLAVALVKALCKVVLPFEPLQRVLSGLITMAAEQWVGSNQLVFRVLHAPAWETEFRERIDPSKSYLVVSNHQSWADILVLFDLMHGRAPFLRFFLKKELIYIPIVGAACWALDMPFMKRHSREAIAANPALRGEDLETTRQFCEKYRDRPIAAVNFLEGTRFTQSKRVEKDSPYRHLLRPKAAGLSFVLNAMGDQFGGILDVTLAYQSSDQSILWSWLCGGQSHLAVHVDLLPIPPDLIAGDYDRDEAFRARFQEWVNGIWVRKDARLERMLTRGQPQARPRLT